MNIPELFSECSGKEAEDASSKVRASACSSSERAILVRRSALWAAYGDALGWISELANKRILSERTEGRGLHGTIAWTRRIGGRTGIITRLPPGCYSDDSQLRLATARAISHHGFDVEMFAKVELPVWLSYALGGGRSTNAAAANLARTNAAWFANRFRNWSASGGNGAAMRIQPHVWASTSLDGEGSFLLDVMRNAICTHSHTTGLMGAVLHALVLAHTMRKGCPPDPNHLLELTVTAAEIPNIIQSDLEVGSIWRKAFEVESGSFDRAWEKAVLETRSAILGATDSMRDPGGTVSYGKMVNQLGLQKPSLRGSGILTAVAATGLTWCEAQPEKALLIAANEIGTDTDTIASMAGAILGVNASEDPPGDVLDADLFCHEADRLVEIARGGQPKCHKYPDLTHWEPPKTHADALGRTLDGGLVVKGLGHAAPLGWPVANSSSEFHWQWLRLESGQTLLIKHRRNLEVVEDSVSKTVGRSNRRTAGRSRHSGIQRTLSPQPAANPRNLQRRTSRQESLSINLQQALKYIAHHKHDDEKVGMALRRVVNLGSRAELAAFIAILVDELRNEED